MGGLGSGNWCRLSTRDSVEGHKKLDIRLLHKKKLLEPGAYYGLYWSDNEGKPCGDMRIRVEENRIILIYRVRFSHETEWEHAEEPVTLTLTPCNFGGRDLGLFALERAVESA